MVAPGIAARHRRALRRYAPSWGIDSSAPGTPGRRCSEPLGELPARDLWDIFHSRRGSRAPAPPTRLSWRDQPRTGCHGLRRRRDQSETVGRRPRTDKPEGQTSLAPAGRPPAHALIGAYFVGATLAASPVRLACGRPDPEGGVSNRGRRDQKLAVGHPKLLASGTSLVESGYMPARPARGVLVGAPQNETQ